MRSHLFLALSVCALVGCDGAAPDDESNATVSSIRSTHYTETRYPIVLLPGLMGFRNILGWVDYWTGIPEALEADGAQVYAIDVSEANSPMVRGEQVIAQLDALRQQLGTDKFNLFGHSAGTLDARYVAATRPDLVASVTSIGGPHLGSAVAKLALDTPIGLGVDAIGALGALIKLMSGGSDPNDAKEAMTWLSPSGAATFAALYPAAMPTTPCGNGAPIVNGIRYYSWSGVGAMTNPLDLLDGVWVLTSLMAGTIPNDGLVNHCSAHLGQVIRDNYLANHIDEINLLFGLVSPLAANPTTLYRDQANRLRNVGL
jgi:triacylglycerol lipase